MTATDESRAALSGIIPSWPTLADRLKATRLFLRVSQVEFAEAIDVPPATLNTWEAGRRPRAIGEIEICRRIHAVYGIDLAWLMYGTDDLTAALERDFRTGSRTTDDDGNVIDERRHRRDPRYRGPHRRATDHTESTAP